MPQKKHAAGENQRPDETLIESETRYRRLFETAQDGILILDASTGEITDLNPFLVKMLGYPHDYFLGKKFWEIVPFKDIETGRTTFRELQEEKVIRYEDLTLETKDGRMVHVEIISNVYLVGEAKVIQFNIRDITARKQAETLQEAVYRIAIATETTKSLNDLYPQIHQIISSVMPAQNFYITLFNEEHNTLQFPYFKDAMDAPFLGEIEPGKGLTAYVLRTGKSLLCTQAVHDELERQGAVILLGVPSAIWLGVPLIIEGKTIGAMVVQHYSDPNAYSEREQHMLEFVSSQVALAITRKQTEDQLRLLSTHDIVTGLYNRVFFEEEMSRIERGRQFPVSIVMADVDHLKATNDSQGHAAGDALLKRLAQVLTTAFRSEDIVARIGGDEFAVLLPNTDKAAEENALERVNRLLKEHNATHQGTPLQVSFGASTAVKFVPLADVLKEADSRMYAEKQARKPAPKKYSSKRA